MPGTRLALTGTSAPTQNALANRTGRHVVQESGELLVIEKVSSQCEIRNLEQLLEQLKDHSGTTERVCIEHMLDSIGQRSFGPLLLLAGLIPASPLSAIPGFPTVAATLAFIVIIQMLAGQEHFWLPGWLLRRCIARKGFNRSLSAMQRPARWIDRLIKPRLKILTTGIAVYPIALMSLCIVLTMPVLELIPTANTLTGIALCIFGLALISYDGLLVIIGMLFFGGFIMAGIAALPGT